MISELTVVSKTEELATLVKESRAFMSSIAKAKTAKLSEFRSKTQVNAPG